MLNMTEEKFKRVIDDVVGKNGVVLELKRDVTELKRDVTEVKRDVTEVKEQNHRHGIKMEDMASNIRLILEAVTPLLRKSQEMQNFDNALHDQQDQMAVTQAALREHISNKKVHITE